MTNPTLERLLDLPATIDHADFVVELATGVAHPERVLNRYAITPELEHAYESALAHVKSALTNEKSAAHYIDGTFGSGKSQFMAVLSLVLAGREEPWLHPKLQPVLARHPWVRERKLLRVHYHFIGAGSVEAKIFRGYLDTIAELHPEAPIPALHQTAAIFQNAQGLRRAMGDAAFFQTLNAGDDGAAAASEGWGDLAEAPLWDAGRFERAVLGADEPLRRELFSALGKTLLPAVRTTSSDYVDIDRGLAIMTDHACALGYEGIVLFLDELILWLASRATNQEWLRSEAQKIAKLVESERADRAVPIVSFVARQRSLDDMVAGALEGSGFETLEQALQYWEGRFTKITLPGRNLPAIVEVRVVRPRGEPEARELHTACDTTLRGAGAGDVAKMLGQEWTRDDFRRVFPFTPALIQVLVELSNYLQRERTGIRVLMEMLKDYLDDYRLGEVVPLGDLFDVLAAGEEPLDGGLKVRFDLAKRLYRDELLRLVRAEHGTDNQQACQRLRDDHPIRLGCAGCPRVECRTDNRLLKTLLLAELLPGLTILRGMTATTLVALNHGTVVSFVPGEETTMAVQRLHTYRGELGQIRIGEEDDPTIRIALDDLDVRPVLQKAHGQDTPANRRRLLRELLFGALGLQQDSNSQELTVEFHGTDRKGKVVFGNVRSMVDDDLQAKADEAFRIVIDYPFDEDDQPPSADERRVEQYRVQGRPTPTVVWLPSFFGAKVRRDLGELLLIRQVLGDRSRYLIEFRPEDQERATKQLESLRDQKVKSVTDALHAAYGISMQFAKELDASQRVEQHIHSLDASLPVGASSRSELRDALLDLAGQVLKGRFPTHPDFRKRVTAPALRDELHGLAALRGYPDERMPLSRADANRFALAAALGLVDLGRDSATWNRSRLQQMRQALDAEVSSRLLARRVIRAFDPSGAMGLSTEVQDFVFRAYAIHERYDIHVDAKAIGDVAIGKLAFDDAELIKPDLPTDTEWINAGRLAGRLFGLTATGGYATTPSVQKFFVDLRNAIKEAREHGAGDLVAALDTWGVFNPEWETSARRQTAEDILTVLDIDASVSATAAVRGLATFRPSQSPEAVERALRSAKAVKATLGDTVRRQVFDSIRNDESPEATNILQRLRAVLAADEIAIALEHEISTLATRATALRPKPKPPIDDEAQRRALDEVQRRLKEAEEQRRLELERREDEKRQQELEERQRQEREQAARRLGRAGSWRGTALAAELNEKLAAAEKTLGEDEQLVVEWKIEPKEPA